MGDTSRNHGHLQYTACWNPISKCGIFLNWQRLNCCICDTKGVLVTLNLSGVKFVRMQQAHVESNIA